jgi:hypothetical protein
MKILLFGKSGQVGCAHPRHAKLVAKTASSAMPSGVDSYCFETKGSVPFSFQVVSDHEHYQTV